MAVVGESTPHFMGGEVPVTGHKALFFVATGQQSPQLSGLLHRLHGGSAGLWHNNFQRLSGGHFKRPALLQMICTFNQRKP